MGIAEAGSDFVERDKNEGALGEARMRDFKAGLAEDEIAIEEDVEIESARAVGECGSAVAAEVALDGEEGIEEIARGERGFKSENGVEKAGLIGVSDGSGGVERRAGHNAAESGETRGGCGESGLRRTGRTGQIGAEGNDGTRHFSSVAERAELAEERRLQH